METGVVGIAATFVSLEISVNALYSIFVTVEGMMIFLRLVQPLKAISPMLSKPSGSRMPDSFLQPLKALLPMLLSVEGRVTVVRAVQPEKAEPPMDCTPSGMSMVCSRALP